MSFADFLKRTRQARERGDITPEQHAQALEREAKKQDSDNAAYLKRQARFIRENEENQRRQARLDAAKKKPKSGGLW